MTDVRISQVPVQVIIRDSDPDVRLTQVPVQVIASHSIPGVRMYQAPVQVLVSNPSPENRIYQSPVQVLINQPRVVFEEAEGNYPVYETDYNGTNVTYITGSWDYTALIGGDIETATYDSSGTVTFTDGEATIVIPGGKVGEYAIIILQQGESIGAFKGLITAMPVTTV